MSRIERASHTPKMMRSCARSFALVTAHQKMMRRCEPIATQWCGPSHAVVSCSPYGSVWSHEVTIMLKKSGVCQDAGCVLNEPRSGEWDLCHDSVTGEKPLLFEPVGRYGNDCKSWSAEDISRSINETLTSRLYFHVAVGSSTSVKTLRKEKRAG